MNLKQQAALVPELSCSDFSANLDFYLRVLGFEIAFERPERKFVENASGLAERIEAFGFQLFEQLETSWYRIDRVERGVTEFLVQDPDGHLLRFSQLLSDRPVA